MKEILHQISELFRSSFLVLLVLAASGFAAWRLVQIQIVSEEMPEQELKNETQYEQIIPATRGEIVDASGERLVSNKTGYNVIVEKAYFPADDAEGNLVLMRTVQLLKDAGYEWNDTMPISVEQPFSFDADRENDVEDLKERLHVNSYATAEDCLDKLMEDYDISPDFTVEERRTIAGLRYEMLLRDFSMSNVFYLANDVDSDTVTRLKELRLSLKGVNIVEEAIRTIERGDVIPHEIGYVGPIYSREEYEKLKENGHNDYALSDMVGKSGLEAACEAELRGENGIKEITVTDGEVSSVRTKEEPVGGQTIQLSIHSGFQTELQKLLSDFCAQLRATDKDCKDANCGAIVTLDTDGNAVLGMATLPTYDMKELLEDYEAVSGQPNTPLVNRATDGLYRPGSTFKTITATAGLCLGKIDGSTNFYCARNYKYIDMMFHCTGTHRYISVTRALTVSCNIFFYELSQRIGVDQLVAYEQMYGLGSPLGLESGDSGGYLACPETFEKLGLEWYVGELLQAGIGQSEVQVTPLQMAVVASTIANEGVRYRPHLIQTYWNNAMTERIADKEPEVVQKIDTGGKQVYNLIEQGMIGAARSSMPAKYDLNRLGITVALKTGTPQSPRGTDSFVIGYAPAEEPEIAFCAMIEGGKNAKYMVRQILQIYAKYYPDSQIGQALG